jgi:hypothetical protein
MNEHDVGISNMLQYFSTFGGMALPGLNGSRELLKILRVS